MHYRFHYIRIVQLCAKELQVINIAVTFKFFFITTASVAEIIVFHIVDA